jgi:hypothetical protein
MALVPARPKLRMGPPAERASNWSWKETLTM